MKTQHKKGWGLGYSLLLEMSISVVRLRSTPNVNYFFMLLILKGQENINIGVSVIHLGLMINIWKIMLRLSTRSMQTTKATYGLLVTTYHNYNLPHIDCSDIKALR